MSIVEDLVVDMFGDTKDIVGVLCAFVKFIENKITIVMVNNWILLFILGF